MAKLTEVIGRIMRRRRAGATREITRRCLRLEPLEDRRLLTVIADYGDAPLPYPTTEAENGAWHITAGPTLGTNHDTESEGVHSTLANADDIAGAPDDEDGVTFGSTIMVGQLGAGVTVNVQNAPSGAKLDAWIDFNQDGSWGGPFETIADSVSVIAGDNPISFDVPSWTLDGPTYARFRLSTAGGLGPGGSAVDGEVEDYQVTILKPVAAVGVFAETDAISMPAGGADSVFAADIDGDGDLDVLSALSVDGKIEWYENDGNPQPGFTPHIISASEVGAQCVFAADVDGDGDVDVLTASSQYSRIAWYENDGNLLPGFTQHTISTSADLARSVFAADLDGDGDLDVLSASQGDHKIAWYENDGSALPSFTPYTISTTAYGAQSVFASDVDGDGDIDVLSASVLDDTIAWHENDGTPGGAGDWTEHEISTAANGAQAVFAADVDGDGDQDVVSASFFDSKVAWYENDITLAGVREWTEVAIASSLLGAISVFAADIDGDGDTDVLAASHSSHKVVWFDNDGSQGFTEKTVSEITGGVMSVFVGDVDGDGDMDALSASYHSQKIAWHENIGNDGENTVIQIGSTVCVSGDRTDNDFTFTNDDTTYTIELAGHPDSPWAFPAIDVETVKFRCALGEDTLTFNGADNLDETAELWPDHGQITFSEKRTVAGVSGVDVTVTVTVEDVESITANMGGGSDRATFHDSEGDDSFTAKAYNSTASMTGVNVSLVATGVEEAEAYADAGGVDTAMLYDSFGNDQYVGGKPVNSTHYSELTSKSFRSYAESFESMLGCARIGDDTAELYDTALDDVARGLLGRQWVFVHGGDGSFNQTKGFDSVTVNASTAITGDVAVVYDTPGGDTFVASPDTAVMKIGTQSIRVNDFPAVWGYARYGGTDQAELEDSPGDDEFEGYPTYVVLLNDDPADVANNFLVRAEFFEDVYAIAENGGDDTAVLEGSADYADHLLARYAKHDPHHYARVTPGAGSALDYSYSLVNFDAVHAYGSAADTKAIDPDTADWLILHGWA